MLNKPHNIRHEENLTSNSVINTEIRGGKWSPIHIPFQVSTHASLPPCGVFPTPAGAGPTFYHGRQPQKPAFALRTPFPPSYEGTDPGLASCMLLTGTLYLEVLSRSRCGETCFCRSSTLTALGQPGSGGTCVAGSWSSHGYRLLTAGFS